VIISKIHASQSPSRWLLDARWSSALQLSIAEQRKLNVENIPHNSPGQHIGPPVLSMQNAIVSEILLPSTRSPPGTFLLHNGSVSHHRELSIIRYIPALAPVYDPEFNSIVNTGNKGRPSFPCSVESSRYSG